MYNNYNKNAFCITLGAPRAITVHLLFLDDNMLRSSSLDSMKGHSQPLGSGFWRQFGQYRQIPVERVLVMNRCNMDLNGQ